MQARHFTRTPPSPPVAYRQAHGDRSNVLSGFEAAR